MSDQARSCTTCALERTCRVRAEQLAMRSVRQIPAGIPLPMACGGDLWELRQERRRTSRRLFANFNPNPRPDAPRIPSTGGLDELQLP